MKFSIFSLAVLTPLVLAQNAPANSSAYLNQILGALTGAGLTSLVSVASAIGNTTNGAALLSSLAQGNKTVFAPNNDAFAAVPSNVSSNPDLLAQVLAYHIINTTVTVNGTQVMPNHTIARTALNGGNYSLPGNRSQPLILSRNSTNATGFEILQAISPNISVSQPVSAANLLVYVVNRVISLPPTLAELATSLVPQLAGLVQQSGLLAPLAASRGITVFAPNDAAIQLVMSSVSMLNSTQIQTVLANHVINGTVVYSNMLTTSNYTSAAGEPFMFMSNSSGAYVRSGNSSYARIIRSDLVINNGVVHTIDGVLVNTASNPQAAASAYSSGIAAATSMESQAPLTATSMMSPSGSAATSSRAAGDLVASLNVFNGLVAAAVGVVGVAVGGGLVLV